MKIFQNNNYNSNIFFNDNLFNSNNINSHFIKNQINEDSNFIKKQNIFLNNNFYQGQIRDNFIEKEKEKKILFFNEFDFNGKNKEKPKDNNESVKKNFASEKRNFNLNDDKNLKKLDEVKKFTNFPLEANEENSENLFLQKKTKRINKTSSGKSKKNKISIRVHRCI